NPSGLSHQALQALDPLVQQQLQHQYQHLQQQQRQQQRQQQQQQQQQQRLPAQHLVRARPSAQPSTQPQRSASQSPPSQQIPQRQHQQNSVQPPRLQGMGAYPPSSPETPLALQQQAFLNGQSTGNFPNFHLQHNLADGVANIPLGSNATVASVPLP